MVTQPLTAVKIGNTHSSKTADWSDRGCRTSNQYEAVLAHFRRHPAAFICMDAFKQEFPGQQFKCTFHMMYYDLEGAICHISVTPSGRISDYVRQLEPISPNIAAEVLAVVKQYGLFRGGE